VSSSQSASRYRHRSEVRVGQTKTREQVFFWLSPRCQRGFGRTGKGRVRKPEESAELIHQIL
jgi:hypothetical protein